jgi:hypothetical protein
MAQILIIVGAVVAVVALLLLAVLMRRPTRGDDSDRFTRARRITTTWAADAGTDLVHPTPGQPGTVDTSPGATDPAADPAAPAERPAAAGAEAGAPAAEPSAADEAIDLRRQTGSRPTRRPPST